MKRIKISTVLNILPVLTLLWVYSFPVIITVHGRTKP